MTSEQRDALLHGLPWQRIGEAGVIATPNEQHPLPACCPG
jgi:hypothetical protein